MIVTVVAAGSPQSISTASGPAGSASTTAVRMPRQANAFTFKMNHEGLAGDGGDAMIPILQTSFDGGSTWLDLVSGASMAGGVVSAVHLTAALTTPAASAIEAASDGALAASTINCTALGTHVRIKGGITDGDNDSVWRINHAILILAD